MYTTLKQRLGRRDEEGFTLIELMVVVLIIAILMAIAIPTFLSARGNAQAKAAESNLRNAITDEQTYLTGPGNGSAYGAATDLTSNSVDNALSFVAALGTGTINPAAIAVAIPSTSSATNPQVGLEAEGADGKFYQVFDNNGTVTYSIGSTNAIPSAPLANTSW